jgi:transposase InsO family protein
VIVTVERISESFMLSAIQQILEAFPFEILGFHADNGGEYINDTIAALLDKLLIKVTKSKPRHSNDNALVESKNRSVVRKLYGYEHIPQHPTSQFSAFNQTQVYRYVNFH